MKCEKCGKEFDEETYKVGWNAVKCPYCGQMQMPESMRIKETSLLFKVEGTTSTAIESTIHKLACPHCGKPIKFKFNVATIEFEKDQKED